MLIRSHLRSFAFDPSLFERLCAQLRSGALGPERSRLAQQPSPLGASDPWVQRPYEAPPKMQAAWQAKGEAALRAGEIGVLILGGGMATRFGGEAKGSFPLKTQASSPTFLSLKIAQLAQLGEHLGAEVSVVVMDSFATQVQLNAHLQAVDWMGIPSHRRHRFSQSIMPRLDGQTLRPFVEALDAPQWTDRALFCAPGHGDTLIRLRESGTLNKLQAQGLRHLLVSNVDNLLASLDPLLVGAHLQGVDAGARVSIEAVPRRPQEQGGCVAQLERGPAIVESFRLPPQTELDDYPDFNTNTLWIDLRALEEIPELGWHPIRREIQDPQGQPKSCIQFEQLIGELSEHQPSQVLRVPRDQRFLPIKRREVLSQAQAEIDRLIAAWHPA